jgi:hypothetical protein
VNALEGYRSGALSRGQVGRLLGLDFSESEEFLKEKLAYLPHAPVELARDRAILDSALAHRLLFPTPLQLTASP